MIAARGCGIAWRRSVSRTKPAKTGDSTISVGLSELDPGHDKSAQNMLRGADEALYEAKRRGKNRVMVNDACRI